jgi:hypothetical protein
MVRHLHWAADGADEHVCWLKRRGYNTPSEWMGEEGDKDRKGIGLRQVSEQAKQWWNDLLTQTASLDRLAINKIIGEEEKALRERFGEPSSPARLVRSGRRVKRSRRQQATKTAQNRNSTQMSPA